MSPDEGRGEGGEDPWCGDKICTPGDENNITCPQDCYCGNRQCEPEENAENCSQDCVATPEECNAYCTNSCYDECVVICVDGDCTSNPKCDFKLVTNLCEVTCEDPRVLIESARECIDLCTAACLNIEIPEV